MIDTIRYAVSYDTTCQAWFPISVPKTRRFSDIRLQKITFAI